MSAERDALATVDQLRIENTRLRLTDAEREAIADAIKTVSEALDLMSGEDSFTTATLRTLLARLA